MADNAREDVSGGGVAQPSIAGKRPDNAPALLGHGLLQISQSPG
jgi:hypothetical protein